MLSISDEDLALLMEITKAKSIRLRIKCDPAVVLHNLLKKEAKRCKMFQKQSPRKASQETSSCAPQKSTTRRRARPAKG